MLTTERAHHLFLYDKETGKLFWKNKPTPTSNRIKVGDEVGNLFCGGRYRQCSVDKQKLLIHRIVWLMHKGSMPLGEIDHIDGNGLNNRIENLRHVSAMGNKMNMPRRTDNTSGVTGVTWHAKAKKWVAQIHHSGRCHYLGLYASIDEAIRIRMKAQNDLGFHPNHGRS